LDAAVVAGVAFLAIVAVAELVLPAVHETPAGFPADVLWRFRVASLGTTATLWITIGLGFGALAQRVIAPRPASAIAAPVRA
jgi:predicted cobalt transporter CbtA